ncbi:GNAT family N-acetyltransferase [Streptomyces sp. HP-A2021]|uniref:GNAT family N-acetyltransferase n=1 Tax=Streptomyces sp. HP-A2021 TaxID=2927875 RepID=UPI001FAFBFCC|nr:GNAT family N-acetyltransferase [Streptomyces sp. HP-A2021]UOB08403.1 GNAT family N-acetyltransferase [Streptomyces sp. HP-A2021]
MLISELSDLWSRLDGEDVRGLLALAVGPGPGRLSRAVEDYRTDPAVRLLGFLGDDRALAVLGLCMEEKRATIVHIAVDPSWQGKGLGRELLKAVAETFDILRMTARTDAGAVGFYRRCGFSVCSLGEVYPGVERFECTLHVIRR